MQNKYLPTMQGRLMQEFQAVKDSMFNIAQAQTSSFKDLLDLQLDYLNGYTTLLFEQATKVSTTKDAKELISLNVEFFGNLKKQNEQFTEKATKVAQKTKEKMDKAFTQTTNQTTKTSTKKTT